MNILIAGLALILTASAFAGVKQIYDKQYMVSLSEKPFAKYREKLSHSNELYKLEYTLEILPEHGGGVEKYTGYASKKKSLNPKSYRIDYLLPDPKNKEQKRNLATIVKKRTISGNFTKKKGTGIYNTQQGNTGLEFERKIKNGHFLFSFLHLYLLQNKPWKKSGKKFEFQALDEEGRIKTGIPPKPFTPVTGKAEYLGQDKVMGKKTSRFRIQWGNVKTEL